MKEGAERVDTASEKFIDEAFIKVDTGLVRLAGSVWEDSRPGDREAINLRYDFLEKPHVFFMAMIVVVGGVPRLIAIDLTGDVRERVPDGQASSALFNSASIW